MERAEECNVFVLQNLSKRSLTITLPQRQQQPSPAQKTSPALCYAVMVDFSFCVDLSWIT